MKKWFIIGGVVLCVSILIPLIIIAQEKEEPKTKELATKLEAFLAKKGKLIVKDFYRLGELDGTYGGSKIEFNALVIYEPGLENTRIRGLKIEVAGGGKYERSDTSFLDLDEIESLSKALAYMTNLSEKWKDTQKEYTEVDFSTKGNFSIGFYQKETKQTAFSSSGYIGKATCFIKMSDLNTVKDLVDKGLKLLNEK